MNRVRTVAAGLALAAVVGFPTHRAMSLVMEPGNLVARGGGPLVPAGQGAGIMEAQYFEIGEPEPRAFPRRRDLAGGSAQSAGTEKPIAASMAISTR